MHSRGGRVGILALAMLVAATSSRADDDTSASVKAEKRAENGATHETDLRRRVEALEEEVRALRGQDADGNPERAEVVSPPVNPGPDPRSARVRLGPTTGLLFESESARLEFHTFSWLRAQSDTRVGDETDVEASVPLARFIIQGSLLDDKLHLFVQPELAGTRDDELLDLFVEWKLDDRLRIRAGQFRTPYSRAFITALSNQQLSQRGFVVDQFRLGRDTGAMASGELASGFFHYDLGIFNGAGINDLSGDRDAPGIVARTELRFGDPVPYDQAPSLALDDPHGVTIDFGGAFARKGIESRSPGNPPSTTTETLWNAMAGVAWMHGPLSVHAEGFWRRATDSPRPTDVFGAYAQLGLFVVPRQIEVGGRVGWVSSGGLSKEGTSNVGPDIYSYEAFVADYWKYGEMLLGHHLKTVLNYRYDSGDPSSASSRDRHRVILQQQILF